MMSSAGTGWMSSIYAFVITRAGRGREKPRETPGRRVQEAQSSTACMYKFISLRGCGSHALRANVRVCADAHVVVVEVLHVVDRVHAVDRARLRRRMLDLAESDIVKAALPDGVGLF